MQISTPYSLLEGDDEVHFQTADDDGEVIDVVHRHGHKPNKKAEKQHTICWHESLDKFLEKQSLGWLKESGLLEN